MECKVCSADNDYQDIDVAPRDHGGISVTWTCYNCGAVHTAFLIPEEFKAVVPD